MVCKKSTTRNIGKYDNWKYEVNMKIGNMQVSYAREVFCGIPKLKKFIDLGMALNYNN